MSSPSGQVPPGPATRFGARQVDTPRSGFFLCRMVKGGPQVPCAIAVDFDMCSFSVDQGRFSKPTAEPHKDRRLMSIWTYGREISEATYRQLLQRPGNRPDPFRPLPDLASLPPLF